MNCIKRSASTLRSPAAAGSVPAAARVPLALRGLMLVAWAMSGSMSGKAFAVEPSAIDYFVASVMVVHTDSGVINP